MDAYPHLLDAAFLSADLLISARKRAGPAVGTVVVSGFARQRFEFAEGLFDWIEPSIGRSSINHQRSGHPIMEQTGHESDRLPIPVRDATDQSLAAWAACSEPTHVGAGRSFIEKRECA